MSAATSYEHEGAYLGGLDQALAARNNGGIVICQVKRITAAGFDEAHDVRVPGMLVDYVIVDPDQKQTTQILYDPAISAKSSGRSSSFACPSSTSRRSSRAASRRNLRMIACVNLGFGISANVPRILIEEGLHGRSPG
jgi:propionate CoA-transferase